VASDRYLRHAQIDWFSQPQLRASRVLVVGAGAIGNEVVKNLCLLGVGAVDVCDFDTVELHNLTRSVFLRESDIGGGKAPALVARAADLNPDVALGSIDGDFWECVTLGQLAQYTCAISAVDNFEARLRLNQMCLAAGVDLVNVAIDSRYAVIESFPFAAHWGCACYECHLPESVYARLAARYSCGGLRRRAQSTRQVPTTAITASVAGAVAVSVALRLGPAGQGGPGARRVLLDTIAGTSTVTDLQRNAECAGCERLTQRPQRLEPVDGESWPFAALQALLVQAPSQPPPVLHLSDALITEFECARCGPRPEAADYLDRRAAAYDDSITHCTSCAEPAIRVAVRQRFELPEFIARFHGKTVPAKFALTVIDGRTVCLDFEQESATCPVN